MGVEDQRERDKLQAESEAQCWAQSHNREIMTLRSLPEPKSRVGNLTD